MEEKERSAQRVHTHARDSSNFFNVAGIEALLFDFETYRNPSFPSNGSDKIAELFFVRVFDLIRSVAYIEIKKHADNRLMLLDAFRTNLYGDEARLAQLLDKVLAVNEMDKMLKEIFPLLEHLRERYIFSVRSQRSECWESSLHSLWRGDSRCASYERCWEEEAPREAVEKCNEFYSSWKNTNLSLPKREYLRTCPVALTSEVYDHCGLLELLTMRPQLEGYLACSLKHCAGGNWSRRHVHGIVVRLLTMCADHYLGELNRLLEAETRGKWYFLVPAPDAAS